MKKKNLGMSYFILFYLCITYIYTRCPNDCSGHGICDSDGRCTCYSQVGLTKDGQGESFTGNDCSMKKCPVGNPFSTVFSKLPSMSGNAPTKNQATEVVNNPQRNLDTISSNRTLADNQITVKEINKDDRLYYVTNFANSLISELGDYGGILKCHYQSDKQENRRRRRRVLTKKNGETIIADVKRWVKDGDIINSYIKFDVKILTETEKTEDLSTSISITSIICDRIVFVRKDWSLYNPSAVDGNKVVKWKNYGKIVYDLGLFTTSDGGEVQTATYSKQVYMACTASVDYNSDITVYKATAVIETTNTTPDDKSDVKFTISDTSKELTPIPQICFLLGENGDNILTTDLGVNMRDTSSNSDGSDLKIGKYTTAEGKIDKTNKHTVIVLKNGESITEKTIITKVANVNDYLKLNSSVYLSVIYNNNIYEVAVRITKIETSTYSFTPELPERTKILPYIRMFPTNSANLLNKELDAELFLYKMNVRIEFITSLQSPEVGGLLECTKDASTYFLIDVKGYKLDDKNEFPIYSFVQFNDALANGELTPETQRRLLDDFGIKDMKCSAIYGRNDLSFLNPKQPKDKKIEWKGYKPILNNMKFKISSNNKLSFACKKGDNQLVIINTTKIEYKDDDVIFTLDIDDVTGITDYVCYLLSDSKGNSMDILDTDLGKNVRVDDKNEYYFGKYVNIGKNNLDIISGEENDKIIVIKEEDNKNVINKNNIICEYEGIDNYLLKGRTIYLSILVKNIIIEKHVVISTVSPNIFTFKEGIKDLYGSTFLYYIRTYPINRLSPLPSPFLKGDKLDGETSMFWIVYYLNTKLQLSSLTDVGGILQCNSGAVEIEADIKGKVENETYAFYILFNQKVDSDSDTGIISIKDIICNKYITKRNDLSLYYSFEITKSTDEQITISTDVTIYSKLLYSMGFFPSEIVDSKYQRTVNTSCMNKDNDIVIYPNVLVSTPSDLTKEISLTFDIKYISLLTKTDSYYCGILSDSKGESLDILKTDIGKNIRKDNKNDQYVVGKYEESKGGIKTDIENGFLVVILPKAAIKENKKEIEIPTEELKKNKKVELYLSKGQNIFIPITNNKVIREHSAKISVVATTAPRRQLDGGTATTPTTTTITFEPQIPSGWNALPTIRTNPIDDGIKENIQNEETSKPPETQPLTVLDDSVNLYVVDKSDSSILYDLTIQLPKTGGILQCKYKDDKNNELKGTVDVKSYSDDKIYAEFKGGIYKENNKVETRSLDEIYNINEIVCDKILSIRNDLSLINPQVVTDNSITWIGYKIIFKSLYTTTDENDISFACYSPNSINQEITVYNDNITVIYKGDNYVFTFIDDKNIKSPSNGDICFLLSDVNCNKITIEESELFSMIRSGKNFNYYFGQYVSVNDNTFNIHYNDNDGSTILTIGKSKSGNDNIDIKSLLEGNLNLNLGLISDSNSLLSLLNPGTQINIYELYSNGKRVFIGSLQIMKITTYNDKTITLSLSDKLLVTLPEVEETEAPTTEVPTTTKPPETTKAAGGGRRNRRRLSPSNGIIGYEIEFRTMETTHIPIECSGQGECNRNTGQCQCYSGFEGSACQRVSCPNNCNENGRCVPLTEILSNKELSSYTGFGNSKTINSDAFPDLVFGCLCDSGRRGADCSLKECPSGVDPLDPVSNGSSDIVKKDCSGRGICNYESGKCECFDGFVGEGCQIMSSVV